MRSRWFALPLVVFATAVLGAACSVDVGPGGSLLTCSEDGAGCFDDSDCCSSYCDPDTATCIGDPLQPGCFDDNQECGVDSDCCSGVCDSDGFCGLAVCESTGAPCTYDSECCQGEYCTSTGDCGSCEVSGGDCTYDLDCCSELCDGGVCD